jgi:hypothetical protein
MKQITIDELFSLFDKEMHDGLVKALDLPGTDGAVVFENLQLDSSALGQRTAVVYGPGRSAKTYAELGATHLNDLPSRRQYPVALYSKRAIL